MYKADQIKTLKLSVVKKGLKSLYRIQNCVDLSVYLV